MVKDRAGTVVSPYTHRGWEVQMIDHTDANANAGVHLFIFSPREKKDDLIYWGISEESVFQQLEQDYIYIEWVE